MESRFEETLKLKVTYSSLQQEVDIKTKKLKEVAAASCSTLPAHMFIYFFNHLF